MKEFLSNIEPESFDQVVYPRMVMGYEMGIKDMFTDDILITPNPEKIIAPRIAPELPQIQKITPQSHVVVTHGVQGAFYPFNSYGIKI